MPGVVEVKSSQAIGEVIDDILLLAEYGSIDDIQDQVRFLPI